MSIFLSCGEASGDTLIADLARGLRRQGYTGILWGMAGERSRAAGVRLRWSSSELQIMGISQAAAALPRLWCLADQMVSEVLRRRPRAVVVADSPDFHIPLVRRLRRKGYAGKVFFLSPPTVWAWRRRRVVPLRQLFDMCLPLFGFEHRFLQDHGVPTAWVGHPMVGRSLPKRAADPHGVALLPGSRHSEISRLLPVLRSLAERLADGGWSPVFSLADNVQGVFRAQVLEALAGWTVRCGDVPRLLAETSMAVGASGTVAVEAMIADRFMTVLYRGTPLEWVVYRAFVNLPFVSIPNVMAGRMVYPELLQDRCTVPAILRALAEYTRCPEPVHRSLSICRRQMGRSGASEFWASLVLTP
ncbi:MAG: lipid-A-disaccharide synthase [Dethiosulfovibrio peptidovorans]|nr:MAG: lipid-A-disaccharide synthase [Dethiosulfovibrio peptidovorans]